MEHLNKRKPNLLFFWFLLPFVLYGGYAVGRLEGDQISIENIREMLLYSLTHPWPMRFTLLTVKALLILLLIWGFAVIWYVGNYRSLIPGLEYGSARFADLKQVNEKLKDADDSKNKILSENIRMSINTRKTGLNNNVTVIGGSGAGKSFHYVMPNAMQNGLLCDRDALNCG
jgi:type IV secretion system protein VirD4